MTVSLHRDSSRPTVTLCSRTTQAAAAGAPSNQGTSRGARRKAVHLLPAPASVQSVRATLWRPERAQADQLAAGRDGRGRARGQLLLAGGQRLVHAGCSMSSLLSCQWLCVGAVAVAVWCVPPSACTFIGVQLPARLRSSSAHTAAANQSVSLPFRSLHKLVLLS